MKTVVVCSGGLDSVTLAYLVRHEHILDRLVTFDYGQRHKVEIEYAARAAADLGVRHDIVDISMLRPFLAGSALTDNVPVPDGHYAEDSMRATIVPNRNPIMLTIAYGIAAADDADFVAAAVHGGDHFIYPDCRPEFIKAFAAMQDLALDGVWRVGLLTPFVDKSKAEIVTIGAGLNVPFERTWSCYRGGEVHCGTCTERREAFALAGVADPTDYADR